MKSNNHFFLLFIIALSFSFTLRTLNANETKLRDKLQNALQTLIDEGSLIGESNLRDGFWTGRLQLGNIGDSCMVHGVNGVFDFTADSMTGTFLFPCWGDTVKLMISALIGSDDIKGSGSLQGKFIAGRFTFSSARDLEGDYDLRLDCRLDSLILQGHLEVIQSRKAKILRSLKNIVNALMFEDLILTIQGDSCIEYRGLELVCAASIDLKSHDPGMKEGVVRVEKGKLWKLGREFQISNAVYYFENAVLYAEAVLKTKAYITSLDSGSVLQTYNVTFLMEGQVPLSLDQSLFSEPELTEEQIISLLVNKDPYALLVSGEVASNIEESIKFAVKKYNSERFTEYAERQVGRTLTFDRVVIEGNVFSTTTHYTAYKGITRRLKLSIRGTVGGSSDQTVSFYYRLGGDFNLVSETNQMGETGLDLKYVLKFR